ncbi:MAG: hypothetical protein IIX02_05030, partial [Clostridia bacterium]|nr:hypothetical protein [Clostridia bacterium]
ANAAEAVDRAFALTGNAFPKNNAVVAVLITALQKGDTETVELIKGKMIAMQDKVSEGDKTYFDAILALTESK